MNRIIFGIIAVFWLISVPVSGQDVSFVASAKSPVQVGERFNLVYTLNTEGDRFSGPQIDHFNVLSGPFSSTSSSIQIINGQLSRAVEVTFTYVLSAIEEGVFDIPPATVQIKGKTYRSNGVKIQVVKGQTRQTPAPGSRQQQQQQSGTGITIGKDVFLKAVVDKTNPYLGEQVIVTYKIYTKVPISSINIEKLSSFQGFWSKNLLGEREKLKQYTEVVNGEEFVVADVRKVALFPQKPGTLTIDPMEMQCVAQVRQQTQQRFRDPFFDSFFNDPFFGRVQNVDLNLKSNSLSINVKPLPSRNRPADFSGSVGSFSFNATADRTSLKSNEALTLKVTVSGTGNIDLVGQPEISFPPDFEVYDPKISLNVNTGNHGVSGHKIFEYLVIPRQPGTFRINPIRYSFFDLKTNSYITLSSEEFVFNIERGAETGGQVVFSGINQQDIMYIGSDIRYIKTGNPGFLLINRHFFNSTAFYLLLAAPVLLFVLFVFIRKKELKRKGNLALIRNRKATRIARKRLRNAYELMKDNKPEQFHVEISQALWGYLSDKFSIALADLSAATVREHFEREQIKPETTDFFLQTLHETEFARFAPGQTGAAMDSIYEKAVQAITGIEKELKQ